GSHRLELQPIDVPNLPAPGKQEHMRAWTLQRSFNQPSPALDLPDLVVHDETNRSPGGDLGDLGNNQGGMDWNESLEPRSAGQIGHGRSDAGPGPAPQGN